MTAPAIAPPTQAVTLGYPIRRNRGFVVFSGGVRVGELWKYGRPGAQPVWRAYRDGFGASTEAFPSQEKAAARVGWDLQVPAIQIHYRAKGKPYGVRLRSPEGDVLSIILAEPDHERQQVFCTALVTGPAGTAGAVRRRVAEQFGVRCIGGGAPGSTGQPVVLFSVAADHLITLHP